MTENAQTPKSDSDRARACRERKREAGEPAIPAFDRVLRDELFRKYHAGELTVDLLELINLTVNRIAGDERERNAAVARSSSRCGTKLGGRDAV
jgi:hypothetical protein